METEKKGLYEVILSTDDCEIETLANDGKEDAIKFLQDYPDGKHLSFVSFSEFREFVNTFKEAIPDTVRSWTWFETELRLSDAEECFILTAYEMWRN